MAPHYIAAFIVIGGSLVLSVSCEINPTFFMRNLDNGPHLELKEADDRSASTPLYLTPLIKAGNINSAKQQSRVNIGGISSIVSYSGYLTVNKQYNSNLFFWFIQAKNNHETAPVVLWLQGGPGDSGLVGLFLEHGPYWIDNNLTPQVRETSWNKDHNMIYIDSPVGTGLSFTENDSGYATSLSNVTDALYTALQQFFTMFPEYQTNDFYTAGESYGGKYAPGLAEKIHNRNPTATLRINLKGVSIGDGLIHPLIQFDMSDFLYQTGIIDKNDKERMEQHIAIMKNHFQNKAWTEVFKKWYEAMMIYLTSSGYKYNYNILQSVDPKLKKEENFHNFLKLPLARTGLHFGNRNFDRGNTVYKNLLSDVAKSVLSSIQTVANHYKVLVYSGNLDIIINYPQTERSLRNLSWTGAEKYRTQQRVKWLVSGELAGYIKKVNNFQHVMVRNAGHMVPADQPHRAQELFTRFTNGTALDTE